MSKEKFVRTKPHVNVAGDPRLLGGAAFSLCVPRPPDGLPITLEAKQLFARRDDSSPWKDYFDDYWTTSSTRDPVRNLMTKAELIAELSSGNSEPIASFSLLECEPVKWEIRPTSQGFAEEVLHFECDEMGSIN